MKVLNRAGLPKSTTFPDFNISWGKQYDPPQYQQCKSWQKINHFSGAYLLGKKDQFHRRITELAARVPSYVDFYPESHILPADAFKFDWKKYKYWIIKPGSSSKGEGISIVPSTNTPPIQECVIQQYIDRPLLIHGKKFDLRMYALVTSISPLRIYMHEYGLGRFATHQYEEAPPTDLFAHLTNVSINIQDPSYKQSQGIDDANPENSKWTLSQVFNELAAEGYDADAIMKKCERVTISCIISAVSQIRKVHSSNVPHRRTSFEMYGIDLLIDADQNVWVMEINISPSMSGRDSKLDWDQKTAIVTEMLNIGGVVDCDPKVGCPSFDKYDDLYKQSLLESAKSFSGSCWNAPHFADMVIVRDFLDEISKSKKFRYVFPTRENVDQYKPCFEHLGYTDVSFHEWIKMSDNERIDALERGKSEYQSTINQI